MAAPRSSENALWFEPVADELLKQATNVFMALEQFVQVFAEVGLTIVLSIALLELRDQAPLFAELLLPPTEILLVPGDVVERHSGSLASSFVNRFKISKGSVEVPRRQAYSSFFALSKSPSYLLLRRKYFLNPAAARPSMTAASTNSAAMIVTPSIPPGAAKW
jgi:hypothetical protein